MSEGDNTMPDESQIPEEPKVTRQKTPVKPEYYGTPISQNILALLKQYEAILSSNLEGSERSVATPDEKQVAAMLKKLDDLDP